MDVDVVESRAGAESIRVDLCHALRKVYDFQKRTFSKRMETNVHDINRQGDAGEFSTAIESLAADVCHPKCSPANGLHCRDDDVSGICIGVVVIDHDKGGLAATSSRSLVRYFAVIDAIGIVVISECILAEQHECHGQN